MWFAVLSCLMGAAFVFGSWRVARAQPSARSLEACVERLQRGESTPLGQQGEGTAVRVAELADRISRAQSRAVAVAELNEFISEVDRDSGVEVPLTLARVCFTSGILLGLLALAAMLAAGGMVGLMSTVPALVAVFAGLSSGMLCYQLGREAKRRRQEFRGVVRRLTRVLQRRFPLEATDVL
jgi:hypothetical protein